MAQHQQFDVFGRVTAGEQHQPGSYPAEHEVDQTRRHEQ
jgi:hypothetical protein